MDGTKALFDRGMSKKYRKRISVRRQNRGLEKCRNVIGCVWNGGIHNTGKQYNKIYEHYSRLIILFLYFLPCYRLNCIDELAEH